ncbi:centromere-associated protein E-like [Anneissia japonica]|uniref:centromere-associated protein E-like n=1 Tax=Anneissia japonica TaxID=1529436 RepID=UPI001425B8F1|nr:centromere-associated protein E-like [Anneissia japonica]
MTSVRMKRFESLSSSGSRPHLRGYSEPSSTMPLYLEQEGLLTRKTHQDNFEFMTSTQLRDELRREKLRRRETEVQLDSMKHPNTFYNSPGGYSSPVLRHTELSHNSMDSDSGISFSNRTKSPVGHSPLLMMARGEVSPQTSTKIDGLSLRSMKDAMYESEKRRVALMDKLREAQETLQLQTDQLREHEAMLTDKQNTVQALVTTNESLQQKIINLQRQSDVNEVSRNETDKKKEVLQRRVDDLDQKLKSLQTSHSTIQSEHRQREVMLEQTTLTLKLVEEENDQLKQTRDTMLKEALALRESLQMSRTKCEKFKVEQKEHEGIRQNCNLLTSKNMEISSELLESQSIVNELRNQLQFIEGDKMKLIQERDSFQSRAVDLEETCSDLSNKLGTASNTKERLIQEKVDLQQLLKYAGFEKEQILTAKKELEERVEEFRTSSHRLTNELRDAQQDKERLENELSAVKKVGEGLSSELSTVKKNLEATEEEERQLQSEKKSAQQQSAYWENEVKRLTGERDSYSKSVDRLRLELDRERDQNSEQSHQLRENVRLIRQERDELQTKCQELETKHKKANSDLHQATLIHQQELDDWKSSCEQLTNNISEKNDEILMLTEKMEEASEKLNELHGENSAYRIRQENFDDYEREIDRLQERLQELTNQHAEDQQVISLLEMQKNILSKNQSSAGNKLNSDHLKAEVERLKAELQLSQDKMIELRAEIDRTQSTEQLQFIRPCSKCEEYLESNARLREINKMMTDRVSKVENDAEMSSKRASEASHFKAKSLSLEEQIDTLQDLNLNLSKQVAKLELENLQMSERVGKAQEVGLRNNDLDEQNQTLQELNKMLTNKISRLEQEHQSVNHARERELFEQNQTLTDINQMLTEKLSKMEQEKKELVMNQSKEPVVSLKEFDRIDREKDKVNADMETLRHEYEDLQERHKQFVSEHLSRTLETSNTMSPESKDIYDSEMRKLKTENETLRRQNDLSHSQTVIADNARKRAEDRIHQTELALADLRKSYESSLSGKASNKEEILKLEGEVRSQVIKNESLQQTISKLQAENKRLVDTQQQKQDKGECPDCKRTRVELDSILQEKDLLEEENEELKQDVEQLESQLDIMQQDVDNRSLHLKSVSYDTKPKDSSDGSTARHISFSEKTILKDSNVSVSKPEISNFRSQGSPRHLTSDRRLSEREIKSIKQNSSPRRYSMQELDPSLPLSSIKGVRSHTSTERRQSQLRELMLPAKFGRNDPTYMSSGSRVDETSACSSISNTVINISKIPVRMLDTSSFLQRPNITADEAD